MKCDFKSQAHSLVESLASCVLYGFRSNKYHLFSSGLFPIWQWKELCLASLVLSPFRIGLFANPFESLPNVALVRSKREEKSATGSMIASWLASCFLLLASNAFIESTICQSLVDLHNLFSNFRRHKFYIQNLSLSLNLFTIMNLSTKQIFKKKKKILRELINLYLL